MPSLATPKAYPPVPRRLPVGADLLPGGGTHFRVWAPERRRVAVVLEDGAEMMLESDGAGYWSGLGPRLGAGTLYRYRLDDDDMLYPDPASRFQPDGPHGPSEVVDPSAFQWSDRGWSGPPFDGQVLYEMHIGTFTAEGTYAAAAERLPDLAELGVTVIELMPVADFPGRFGWGYDGVNLFAPTRLYGRPDDLRHFVDRAHGLGLAVILDVVYNHFGPDGNFVSCFSPGYFTDKYENEWGEAINFDGADAGPVREFFITNAAYWIDEYHFDGLRLDATQTIHDASPSHVLTEIASAVRSAAGKRRTLLVAENEPQHVRLVRPAETGGHGLDVLWNDDFHHSAMVAATGRNEAYYRDHRGTPQELISAAKYGFLYQGQHYSWQDKRRGTPTFGLAAAHFVNFLQNHDQVANSARGLRLHQIASPGRFRALTALTLLMPGTPMLFQGQEFAADQPFLYFADHKPELAHKVQLGRAEFLSQFPSIAQEEVRAGLPPPHASATFRACKLDHDHRGSHGWAWALHKDLLALRRSDPVLSRPTFIDGAVLGEEALALRWFGQEGDDRLLLVNLGRDLPLVPAPEPLLAPPAGRSWSVRWASEAPRYGGLGTAPPERPDGWHLPGQGAILVSAGAI